MGGGSSDPPHRQDRLVRRTIFASERDLADLETTPSESPRSPYPIYEQPPARLSTYNHNSFLLNNDALSGTTLFSSLPPPLNDWRFTVFLIRTPSLLYQYVCNKKGGNQGIELLINTLANSQFFLEKLLDSLSEILVELARSSKGRRAIVYCFTNVQSSHTRALSFKMLQNCLPLARDKSGCILVNECIPLMEETRRRCMLFIIWKHAHSLAQHCYGTYVVQNVVSTQYPIFTERIVMEIMSLFLVLSTQKEGSHLVEKCISSCLTRKIAVKALVELEPAELKEIACNEFGNFVIQKALLSTKDSDQFLELHLKLLSALLPLVDDLKGQKYGRNVASKLRNRRC